MNWLKFNIEGKTTRFITKVRKMVGFHLSSDDPSRWRFGKSRSGQAGIPKRQGLEEKAGDSSQVNQLLIQRRFRNFGAFPFQEPPSFFGSASEPLPGLNISASPKHNSFIPFHS